MFQYLTSFKKKSQLKMRAHRFFSVHFFQYFSKSLNLFAHRMTGAQQGGGNGGQAIPPHLRNYSVTVHLHFLQVILIDCTFMYSRSNFAS